MRIPPMNPKHPALKTEHHRSVGVGDDAIDVPEPELLQSARELILEQEQLPIHPRTDTRPAAPLPRVPPSPLPPPAIETATFGAPFRANETLSEGIKCRFPETQRKC